MSETSSLKPYVGLIPFHEEDAEFFFGRRQEQEIITSNLMASRLTLLYGASGVGKSSVLHAGVAHNLRGLARRDIKRLGKPKFTVVIFSAWRDEPVASLLEHVRKAVMKTLEGQSVEPVPPNLPFVESLREWARRVQGHLLIILDQFEEYFLYHPHEDGEGTFAVEFPRAVNAPGLPANFIVSYREDAHSKLDFFKGRIPNLYDNYLRIGHLGYVAARAAIEKPIERYNQLAGLDNSALKQRYSLEEDLVAAVLSQVRAGEKYIGEAGKGVIDDHAESDDKGWEVETPYLQLVMTQLWDTEIQSGSRVLQLATLNKLGGAKRIVQTHLDNAMGELSSKEQLMGASIFNYLVTPSGTKIAQTAHDLADYANLSAEKEKQLDQMMEKLTGGDRRILRSVPPPANQPNASRYEVFHDVLAQAILEWRRRYLARRDRVRLLKVVGGMALLLLFMGGVTVYAFQQSREARRQRSFAENATSQVQKEKGRTEEERDRARKAEREEAAQKLTAEGERDRARAAEKIAEAQTKEAVAQREAADRAKATLAIQNTKLLDAQSTLASRNAELSKLSTELTKRNADLEAATKLAETKQTEAEQARERAEEARHQAEEALATVEEIDASNAYYKTVMRPGRNVTNASFSADGTKALTVSDDGVARIWDVNSTTKPNEPTHELEPEEGAIFSASFSPDGEFLVIVSNEPEALAGTATIWNLKTKRHDTFSIHDEKNNPVMLFGAAFSPDGRTVTAYGSGELRVCDWDPASAKVKDCLTLTQSDSPQPLIVESLSPDGKAIVLLSPEEIFLWDKITRSKVRLIQPPGLNTSNIGTKVIFSPDGKYVATASPFNGAHLYERRTGAFVGEFKGEKDVVSKVSFSPDGKVVVTAGGEGTAHIWDTKSQQKIATLRGHTAALTDVAFSPDGQYVVTASGDKTARVWDVKEGRLFAELRGHIKAVDSTMFSPDGNYVLTSGDKTARVWDVTRRASGATPARTGIIENGGTFDFDTGSSNYEPPILGVRPAQTPGPSDVYWQYLVKDNPPGTSDLATWALSPENNAQIAFFSDKAKREFDQITVTELVGLNYSSVGLRGGAVADRSGGSVEDPLVGLVFAIRTSAGNYAKVEVLERGEKLKIKWVTYPDPNPTPPAPQLLSPSRKKPPPQQIQERPSQQQPTPPEVLKDTARASRQLSENQQSGPEGSWFTLGLPVSRLERKWPFPLKLIGIESKPPAPASRKSKD